MAGIRTEIIITTDDDEKAVLAAWDPTGLAAAVGKVAKAQLKMVNDWLVRASKSAAFKSEDVEAGRQHLTVVGYWADVLGQHEPDAAAGFQASSERVAKVVSTMEQLLASQTAAA